MLAFFNILFGLALAVMLCLAASVQRGQYDGPVDQAEAEWFADLELASEEDLVARGPAQLAMDRERLADVAEYFRRGRTVTRSGIAQGRAAEQAGRLERAWAAARAPL